MGEPMSVLLPSTFQSYPVQGFHSVLFFLRCCVAHISALLHCTSFCAAALHAFTWKQDALSSMRMLMLAVHNKGVKVHCRGPSTPLLHCICWSVRGQDSSEACCVLVSTFPKNFRGGWELRAGKVGRQDPQQQEKDAKSSS